MTLALDRTTFDLVQEHACETYPDECCGMIIDRGGREEVVRITNIQNELHAKDPAQFPRTAAIAYTMGPEAAPILLSAERGAVILRAFYHSHPDHEAYFSVEDRTQALGGWDEPTYPNAVQIVLSVRTRSVRAAKAFAWNASAGDFIEIPLVIR